MNRPGFPARGTDFLEGSAVLHLTIAASTRQSQQAPPTERFSIEKGDSARGRSARFHAGARESFIVLRFRLATVGTVGIVLAILLSTLTGAAAGVGAFTFVYARGASYLTNDPEACVNCHVMRDNFDAWGKSSHHAVATCNDCHAPHDIVGKLWVKGRNGFNHSLAFVSGNFPEPIRITEFNRGVTEASCRHCHANMVSAIDAFHSGSDSLSCLRCHQDVGHMH